MHPIVTMGTSGPSNASLNSKKVALDGEAIDGDGDLRQLLTEPVSQPLDLLRPTWPLDSAPTKYY